MVRREDRFRLPFYFWRSKGRIAKLGLGVWGLGFGVWGQGLGLGAWAWGLGSGAWGLGFEVCKLKNRKRKNGIPKSYPTGVQG